MKFYDLHSGHFVVVGKRKLHWLIVAYDKRENNVEVITVIDTKQEP